jgi:hypothetical protein
MGAAIDYLYQYGLSAKANGESIIVSPASRLTDDVRQYVRTHRQGLLTELASNDRPERRNAWCITRHGKSLCSMIGEPMTYAEALEAARWRWPDADVIQGHD